jgi:hypothetical protein
MTVHAQDTTVVTKTMAGDEMKTIKYTGCVQTGTETRTYVLAQAVPVSRTTTSERPGALGPTTTTTTTTTYELVPGESVQLEQQIGHKVEVTGMLIPGGDTKTETKTKIEREDAPDTTIKEKSKSEGGMPQFRVISVRSLGETCTPS